MAKYVDGFVLVIPKGKTEEYKKMAMEGRDIWMKNGAIGYYECRGEDLNPKEMGPEKTRAFPDLAGAGPDEEVWFSFVIYPSKEDRDRINAKVMEEMSKLPAPPVMPFDMKRMTVGGFAVEVEG